MRYSVPLLGYIFMRVVWFTLKKKYHYTTPLSEAQHLYVCWHGELLMSPQAYRVLHPNHQAVAMISHHFDGELIAKVYGFLGVGAVRGSGRRGAKEVFIKAFRAIKEGKELLLTPDGPKGPRHFMYDGAVALSLKTNTPLCVINFTSTGYWQLKSWDRFVIPKPFSSIDFFIEPLDLSGMELVEAKEYLREKMLQHTIV